MGLFDPRSHGARDYFRRAGRMFLVAAAVVVAVTIFAAPDTFGRVAGALIALVITARALMMFRKARQVSPTALVHEQMGVRNVRYVVEDPENLNDRSKL
jgi:hypothetical protein